jgi:hypothetical protein
MLESGVGCWFLTAATQTLAKADGSEGRDEKAQKMAVDQSSSVTSTWNWGLLKLKKCTLRNTPAALTWICQPRSAEVGLWIGGAKIKRIHRLHSVFQRC